MKRIVIAIAVALTWLMPAMANADACAAAERELTFGEVALKRAKDEQGYLKSAREFEAATMKAPACAAAHFNLGVVLEKAGAFEKARQALLRYLELTPNAADAAAVRKKTYELEYLAREGGRLGTAVAVPSQLSSPWAKLEGVWCRINTCHDESQVFDVTVKGKELHMVMRPYYFHVFNCRLGSRDEYVGAISDDGAIRGTRKMGNKRFEPRCAAGGEPINQWNYQTGPVTGRVMAQGTIIEFQFDQWVQGSRLPTIFKFRRR